MTATIQMKNNNRAARKSKPRPSAKAKKAVNGRMILQFWVIKKLGIVGLLYRTDEGKKNFKTLIFFLEGISIQEYPRAQPGPLLSGNR